MKDKTVECIDACCEDEVLIVYRDNDGKIKMAPGILDPGEGFASFRDNSVIWHGDIIALGDDQSLRVFAALLKSDSTIGGGLR